MQAKVRFLGLDVHDATIPVAVAEADGSERSLGTIANRAESIRTLVKKLGPVEQLRACYEAGPKGYVLYWKLAGNRVKTDRRDAEKLARSYRSGNLTAVWVPDEGSEALRDLVRAREAAKQDQLRTRHRLSKFLLRTRRRRAVGMKAWTAPYMPWVRQVQVAQSAQEATLLDYLHEVDHQGERVRRSEQAITEAVKLASPQVQEVVKGLQALRGIAEISAVTIVSELSQFSRQLMGYSGAVPSEDSSGKRKQWKQHHQDRQRSSPTHRCRSRLGLSAPTRYRAQIAQATGRGSGTNQGEGTAAGASTKENPRFPYAAGLAGLAPLVRGSSRWIMIMRLRPANIRLINRRSNLPRLPLALSSNNCKGNDKYKNNPTVVRGGQDL
jgi:transposase